MPYNGFRMLRARLFVPLAALVVAVWGFATPLAGRHQEPPRKIDFNRDVRPILAKRCWTCHGTDKVALARTGNLSLDSFAGATADRGGYRALVPGKPGDSMMIKRIEMGSMPPRASGIDPVTPEERAILERWIEAGGEYRKHWAYEAPKTPVPPKVSNPKWVRNPIDAFVLAELDRVGLAPEPEADRETLIRRASLTLTGLPPTPAEIDAFLADKKPEAYERLVDRLLASPRYGENQARYWLDAVRYADTHGLHIDNERAVYPYRDWVVRALSEDLPFDQFTIWQIAGDLLPKPTLDQKIATGYIRMNPTTNEGGVIEAEFLAKNTFDRVDTTSTIFLATTLACAKCHDHKYDPISQKDYYALYAFFNSTADPPLDGNLKLHAPVMKAPDPGQQRELARLQTEMDAVLAKTDLHAAKTWAKANAPTFPEMTAWQVAGPFEAKSFDEAFAAPRGPEPNSSEVATWRDIKIENEKPIVPVVGKENAAAYLRTTLTASVAGPVGLRFDSDDAIRIWLNGALVHDNKALRGLGMGADNVKLDLKQGQNDLLVKIVNSGGPDGFFYAMGDAVARRKVRAAQLAAAASLKPEESRECLDSYLELGPESKPAVRYRELKAAYAKVDADVPFTYIAEELPKPRETRVLKRGEYSMPGEAVDRAVPLALGSLPPKAPKNRLGLAQWLVDPSNPLVARVTVNRIWQQHFGEGIVRSSEDFGSRGEWPSNPALLDFLAARFVKDGWSLKKFNRLIVTSATFRQASTASAQKRAKDPENRMLSRGPRFRLDAEVVRDSALYAAGLLVERPGGHGDKPYMPTGLWEAIAYPISDTAKYVQDKGQALYRRSLYLFWKRTSPPPTMLLFDAPMRESCVVRRSRTNTPLQALATLNETGFVEAARRMAQRILSERTSPDDRVDHAFRIAVGRRPSSTERRIVLDLVASERKNFEADREAAEQLLAIGESSRDRKLDTTDLAAWTLACNLVLNLDEALTQH